MSYITLISKGFNPHMQVVSISDDEPTQVDLVALWKNHALTSVQTKHGAVSDLIEVYESKQIEQAFVNSNFTDICIGTLLTPNIASMEDAISHFYR